VSGRWFSLRTVKSKVEKLRENAVKKRREAECVEVVIEETGLRFKIAWYDVDAWKRVFNQRGIVATFVDKRVAPQ
jgi:hypothetical protein